MSILTEELKEAIALSDGSSYERGIMEQEEKYKAMREEKEKQKRQEIFNDKKKLHAEFW